ncbi:MAG: RagB/SusD family nutrient uptake outer membrane protein, partial [Chitinophagaceae bacterium]|nr:RagB/SusD family nutrient uptake outer membrane protein [Chitinophagaceae bacterium]
ICSSRSLTPAVRKQLLGELKFFRSLFYYYIVNLYGDVPWVTTTDYTVNSRIARTAATQVLKNIQADLREAKEELSELFLDGTLLNAAAGNRYRVTSFAASALLAKVCLMTGDWEEAATEAGRLIDNHSIFMLDTLEGCFLVNSPEAIWQLQTVRSWITTTEGNMFMLPASGPGELKPFFVSHLLVSNFEPGDERKSKWMDTVRANNILYYYPTKYKVTGGSAQPAEAATFLRLSDMYLCRAEARMQQERLTEAIGDLDAVRDRAGLPHLGMMDKSAVKDTLLHERQVEMFTELGARFLDMKRLGKIDALMPGICAYKGINWSPYRAFLPIGYPDISRNPNLTQNDGY